MRDILIEIEQTAPGYEMPCGGGLLHGKSLTWAQAIALKNLHPYANLTNEFKPGKGEGMDKHTYAIHTSPHHLAHLRNADVTNELQQHQLLLLT